MGFQFCLSVFAAVYSTCSRSLSVAECVGAGSLLVYLSGTVCRVVFVHQLASSVTYFVIILSASFLFSNCSLIKYPHKLPI